MQIEPARLARMNDEEISLAAEGFLDQIIAAGMTDGAMPNLAMLLHDASLLAAMRRPSRPTCRPRVVSRREDNVIEVDFGRR